MMLCACGQEVGPQAREFNAERTRADRAAEARLKTRLVKPPALTNGGYVVEPGTIDMRGSSEREEPRASTVTDRRTGPTDAADPTRPPRAIGPAGSKTAIAMRKREMDEVVKQAEMRRRRTIAAQTAHAAAEAKRRLAAVSKADAQRRSAFKPGDARMVPPSRGSLTTSRPKRDAGKPATAKGGSTRPGMDRPAAKKE